jgi:hypothetical protein
MDNSAATNYNGGISWFVGLPQKNKNNEEPTRLKSNKKI